MVLDGPSCSALFVFFIGEDWTYVDTVVFFYEIVLRKTSIGDHTSGSGSCALNYQASRNLGAPGLTWGVAMRKSPARHRSTCHVQ